MSEPRELTPMAAARPALDRLFDTVYDQLHALAHAQLAGRGPSDTLNTTALVHEAYLKLVGSPRTAIQDHRHFLALAARAMRQITVDHARRAQAAKRGGAMVRVPLSASHGASRTARPDPGELIALDRAMARLEAVDERLVRIVELRFFAGLSVEETGDVLELSPRTVKRDWRKARALLLHEMRGAASA